MEPVHRDQETVILIHPSVPPVLAQLPADVLGEPLGPHALGPFIPFPSNTSSHLHPQYTQVPSLFILAEGEPAPSRP